MQPCIGLDVAGKTSVVTGGNSGIGVETVRALATAGSRVILTSRSVPAGEKVAKDLKASGVKVKLCAAGFPATSAASFSIVSCCLICTHALCICMAKFRTVIEMAV